MNNDTLELLDKDIIINYIDCKHRYLAEDMVIINELTSTNDFLSDKARSKNNTINICLAERQTNGKGRLGRSWFSPFARNIYLSILWSFTKKSHEICGLSIAAAVARTLNHYGIQSDIGLKWPNDILWKKRKIAGILIELVRQIHNTCHIIIGIGLNVNMQPSDPNTEKISQPWCSVAQISHTPTQRNKIAGLLLNELFETMHEYQHHGIEAFLKTWRQLDITVNKKISIKTQQVETSGTSLGINDKGHLLLRTNDNKTIACNTGEIFLQKKGIVE